MRKERNASGTAFCETMQIRMEKVNLRSCQVKHIYLDAFSKKERMPFAVMVAMSKLWNTQFWAFYDGDTLCGFVYLAHNRGMAFIMFLAVERALRSKGYGSTILQKLRTMYPDRTIVVSIEPCDDGAPDLAVRKRRKAFYGKNGYHETGYLMKLGGVVQEILVANGEFSEKEFRRFFVFYSNGTVWPRIWTKAGQIRE